MTLPAGIKTKTLTISPGVGILGAQSSIEILFEIVPQSIVWKATGESLLSLLPLYRTNTPNTTAVLKVPTTDQSGFTDENGNPAPDFHYQIKVRYLVDNRKVGKTRVKYYKPLADSPNTQDFDLLPSSEEPVVNQGPRGYEGPPGPKGEKGDSGDVVFSAVLSYTHIQGTPSNSWVINHNLSFVPGVTVVDSAGTEVEGSVKYLSPSTLSVTFAGAFSGQAYLS